MTIIPILMKLRRKDHESDSLAKEHNPASKRAKIKVLERRLSKKSTGWSS